MKPSTNAEKIGTKFGHVNGPSVQRDRKPKVTPAPRGEVHRVNDIPVFLKAPAKQGTVHGMMPQPKIKVTPAPQGEYHGPSVQHAWFNELLDRSAAAAELKVSYATVARWHAQNYRGFRDIWTRMPGMVRVRRDRLHAWLDEGLGLLEGELPAKKGGRK
jgi:hypothetical protein